MSYELFYDDDGHRGPYKTLEAAMAAAFHLVLGYAHVHPSISIVNRDQDNWMVKRKRVVVHRVTIAEVESALTAFEPMLARYLLDRPMIQVVVSGGAITAVHGLPEKGAYDLCDYDNRDEWDNDFQKWVPTHKEEWRN